MARNHEKYVYAELAIPRNSAWYPLLAAEAEAKGLPLSQIALERLAASYLTGNQVAPTAVVPSVPAAGRQLSTLPPAPAVPKPSRIETTGNPVDDDDELELSEERAARNAVAFLEVNGGGFF